MRALLIAAIVLWTAVADLPDVHVGCPCRLARATNSWCDICKVGYIGPVEVRSQYLHEVLDAHGHQLVASSLPCPACRKAAESDGFCELHHTGFTGGLAYFSRLSYEIARGTVVDPSGLTCAVCRRNALDHGWCPRCRLGRVGNVVLRDRKAHDDVAEAIRIVRLADDMALRCEHCAAAIVTGTECPIHRIRFKDGKPIPAERATPPRP